MFHNISTAFGTMCCTRCLQILNCIAAVLISINGMELGEDRLSNVSKMKQRELDYGERLSSMEDDDHDGLRGELDRQGADKEPLIGKLKEPKKVLQNEETLLENKDKKSTKCTTNQPIQVDANGEIKNSDETPPNEETTEPIDYSNITDHYPDTGNDTIDTTTDNGSDTGEDGIMNGTDKAITPAGSGENRVDLDSGEPQDPSKDNDYDATVSTKKYYGAHESYFPDHYLDDA